MLLVQVNGASQPGLGRQPSWRGKEVVCTVNLPPRQNHRTMAVAAEQLAYWDVVEYAHHPVNQQPGTSTGVRLGLVQQVCTNHDMAIMPQRQPSRLS